MEGVVLFHFNDLVVEAWLLYRIDSDTLGIPKKQQLPLLQFKLAVATGLRMDQTPAVEMRRGRPSIKTKIGLKTMWWCFSCTTTKRNQNERICTLA